MPADTRRSSPLDRLCRRPVESATRWVCHRGPQRRRRHLPAASAELSIRGLVQQSDESAEDGHVRRKANGVSWKNPHANGLKHDRLALAVRFFPASCGTTRGADRRTIHTPKFLADRADIHMGRAQPLENRIECAVCIPLVKESPGGLPFAKLLWKIAPGRPRSQNPKDPINNFATINRRATCGSRLPKQIRNADPLFVREQQSSH